MTNTLETVSQGNLQSFYFYFTVHPIQNCLAHTAFVTTQLQRWYWTHHWCLSDKPFQRGSVRTMRSISFFHSMPSEMTRCHSLHTSSAEHSERASRNDRMFSAMWSRPWATGKKGGKTGGFSMPGVGKKMSINVTFCDGVFNVKTLFN